MCVMNVQIDVMVVVVVCSIDTFCNESVPAFMHHTDTDMENQKRVNKLHISRMIILVLEPNQNLRCDLGQFYKHADALRNTEGLVFAHYDGVQYGAQRMSSTDGSIVSTHSLFRVQALAVDTVKLVCVHPTILKSKIVELPLVVYDVMFKLVGGQLTDHEHRIARANSTHEKSQHLVYNFHPAYQIVRDSHIEKTSGRINQKTNRLFDVRGQPISRGDIVRGCAWPDEDAQAMYSVPLSALQECAGMLQTQAADMQLPVTSVVHQQYADLVGHGIMQLSNTLDKQCLRVMGFMRIEPAQDDGTPQAMEDPFFAVVHVMTSAHDPAIDKLDPKCRMLLVPRHRSGNWFLVNSGLPGPAAIAVMLRHGAIGATSILVRPFLIACLCLNASSL